ncbi:hypothetical protein NUACC21_20660 [Scytonema sp. NUACC21]
MNWNLPYTIKATTTKPSPTEVTAKIGGDACGSNAGTSWDAFVGVVFVVAVFGFADWAALTKMDMIDKHKK